MSISTNKNVFFCHSCRAGGNVVQFIAKMEGKTPREVVGNGRPAKVDMARIVAEYTYCDPQGNPLYQVVRFEPKDFRQRKYNAETNRYQWNMDGVRPVPYNLRKIYERPKAAVWIVEGEKDCHTLDEIGVTIGTTNSGGAGKWTEDHSSWLFDRDVILCGDNDVPGREHMNRVFESVYTFAKSISRVELPSKFKDVTEMRQSFDSAAKFAEALGRLVQQPIPGLFYTYPPDATQEQKEAVQAALNAAKAVMPKSSKGRKCFYDLIWTIAQCQTVSLRARKDA